MLRKQACSSIPLPEISLFVMFSVRMPCSRNASVHGLGDPLIVLLVRVPRTQGDEAPRPA